ncbi:MAG: glycosyltransferase [Candidatus Latescibacteria bacterium]|nr:glycosyltransferase [Candidatus Latescibacterota bacterium]
MEQFGAAVPTFIEFSYSFCRPPFTEDRPIAHSPRILFLTRRYPPCLGGIETHSYQLYTHLSAQGPVHLVALRQQSLLHLAWFLPWALLKALWILALQRVDVVYFSDGVIAALAPLLRPFSRGLLVATIHGLELTYPNPLANRLIRWGVDCCQRIVVVSRLTGDIAQEAGIAAEKQRVVYAGMEPLELPAAQVEPLKRRFEEEYGLRFGHDRILLNFGRKVPRKGVAAFIEKGMPLLAPDIKLLIGGRGPENERLPQLVEKLGLQSRVFVLGPLSEEISAVLRQSADLFLMPNVHIPGDVEGFGIAPLESLSVGTPVVAFAVDGLVESIREGGYLVAADDYPAFVEHIHRHYALTPQEQAAKSDQARAYVRREYTWSKNAAQYLDLVEEWFAGKSA